MQKYNARKRGTYRQATQATTQRINAQHDKCDGHDACDRYKHIHIRIKYDTYNRNGYISDIYRKTRDTHAQRYTNIVNAINEIFPEINEPHTQHTHRANAEYHKFIPHAPEIPYTAPENAFTYTRHTTDTDTVKCIIYGTNDQILHIGWMKRTIETHDTNIRITLHRNDRHMDVHPYVPRTDTIHGVPLMEIYRNKVEIYQV